MAGTTKVECVFSTGSSKRCLRHAGSLLVAPALCSLGPTKSKQERLRPNGFYHSLGRPHACTKWKGHVSDACLIL